MPNWDDDQGFQSTELTPKQRLLGWIQNKVADISITNFTSNWNDGRAIGALVDGVAPGLFGILLSYLRRLYLNSTDESVK